MAKQTSPSKRGDRPRVLVLGGGFAGIGAARKLKDADADVVLSTSTTTTRSSRCCTRSRPTCSSTSRSGTAPRPLPRPAERRRPPGDGDRRSTSSSARCSSPTMAPLDLRLPRARAGRRGQLLRRSRAPPSTPSRCTRWPTPCGSRSTSSRRWEAADRDPSLVDDGALNVVVVGGGADRRRERRRAGRALPQQLRQGLSARCRRRRRG